MASEGDSSPSFQFVVMTVTDLAPIPICNSQKRPFVKILIISDAWHPQVNGVVRTLESTAKELARLGHETRIVGPDAARWLTFAAPSYPEIKLEFFAYRRLGRVLYPDSLRIRENFLAFCG